MKVDSTEQAIQPSKKSKGKLWRVRRGCGGAYMAALLVVIKVSL